MSYIFLFTLHFFFFNDTAPTEIYTLSLHDALPISTDTNVIWVGSDDGLVHVTRDGGKTWTNVAGRFPGLPKDAEGRVYQLGVSPFDAGTAYLAVDRHQLDDRRAYVYKTTDFGRTWTDIARGLPTDVPARVVRENPNARGFLVLG